MNAPITNLTPKQRFQAHARTLSNHRDLLSSAAYQAAIDNALLQYQTELAMGCKDQYSSMAMGLRLLGAQEFIQKLFELGVIQTQRTTVTEDNLDHTV